MNVFLKPLQIHVFTNHGMTRITNKLENLENKRRENLTSLQHKITYNLSESLELKLEELLKNVGENLGGNMSPR